MIAVTPASPMNGLTNYLANEQLVVNGNAAYSERIQAAKNRWQSLNRNTNPTFLQIRELLQTTNGSIHRCAYCEDSLGHQIEHIYPKALFPSVVFSWNNFLHACGSCNGAKLAKFALLNGANSIVTLDCRNPPVIEPTPVNSVLIDPRVENPLDFMILDMCDTFNFVPTHLSPVRADYTIETLQLNYRAGLVAARRAAFGIYRASLVEYVTAKSGGAAQAVLAKIARRICYETSHRTVWEEIKRQHAKAPWLAEFRAWFAAYPEALDW